VERRSTLCSRSTPKSAWQARAKEAEPKQKMLLVVAALSLTGFAPAEQFERWAHFHWALPKVQGDALSQAAIATGSCWLLNEPFDSFFFWRRPAATAAVLEALGSAGSSEASLGASSNFTLTAKAAMTSPCAAAQAKSTSVPPPHDGFTIGALAAAAQNWYHALCAPASDPSWTVNGYDPAYQPQQMALTAGLLCIATCDVSNASLPATAIGAIQQSPSEAAAAVCAKFPWNSASMSTFSSAATRVELASRLDPLRGALCRCGGEPPKPQRPVWQWVAACVLLALLLAVAYKGWRQTRTAAARQGKLLSRNPGEFSTQPEPMASGSAHGRSQALVQASSSV